MHNLIIHLGRHKTGTSSLQKFFHDNEIELQNNGVHYLKSFRKQLGHHRLAEELRKLNLTMRETSTLDSHLFNQLNQELQMVNAEQTLISSEGFQHIPFEVTAEFFSSHRVHYIIYIRDQCDYAISAYSQGVQAGHISKTLECYLTELKPLNYFHMYKNMLRIAQKKEATFTLRCYDRVYLRNGDIIDDFLATADLETNKLVRTKSERRNPSVGGCLLALQLFINKNTNLDARTIRKLFYKAFSSLASTYDEYRQKPSMPEKFASLIKHETDPSNKKLAQYLFHRGELFSSRAPSKIKNNIFDPSKFSSAEIELLLDRIYQLDDKLSLSIGDALGRAHMPNVTWLSRKWRETFP